MQMLAGAAATRRASGSVQEVRQVSEIAELYGLDAARSLQVDEHASCQDAGQLYGGAYCLATHKPGVCAGVKRGGAQQQQVQPYQRPHVAVPVAPAAKTRQQSDLEQAAQGGYAAAYQHAQQLAQQLGANQGHARDRKSTRLNSSHLGISYAVFCLKKKKQ